MKGLGAGMIVTATAGLPKAARAADGGQIKLAWVDHIDTLDPHFTRLFPRRGEGAQQHL